ncbi:MAG: hypothetical protein IJ779_11050 [Ruminococcus sp.]|nr:hypothetical protein [Ruminococcus sp.]
MAFCKYCGKELTEGSLCSCPGAIHEQQANAQAEEKYLYTEDAPENSGAPVSSTPQPTAYSSSSDGPAIRRVDTGINDRKTDDGSFKKFGAMVAAVLLVFIIILGSMISGSGYKSTVKKYFSSRYSKHGGKTYYSLTLPQDCIDELKDDDLWRDLVEDYNDDVENRMDDWDRKPKFRKISKVKDMKNSDLKDAEKYFYSAAVMCGADVDEEDIQVKKGYAVTYKFKNTEGDNDKTTVYAVKLKGDGWKIMGEQSTSFYGFDN